MHVRCDVPIRSDDPIASPGQRRIAAKPTIRQGAAPVVSETEWLEVAAVESSKREIMSADAFVDLISPEVLRSTYEV